MLAEGFIALERSVHHVTMLMETVSELNLSGQMHAMTWGNEMLADGFHTKDHSMCKRDTEDRPHIEDSGE